MSDNLKSIVFTLILCIVCSLLLTAATTMLKPRQEENILFNKHLNILKAAGYIKNGTEKTKPEIEKLYTEKIRPAKINNLNFYITLDIKNNISGYIIPLISDGLWGKINGYIAMKKDGKTISGFTVSHHEETPGLGGEIEHQPFQKDFKNKLIVNKRGNFTGIKIAKGKAKNSVPENIRSHYVDGISGATLTGKYLTIGLMKTLKDFEPVSAKFRSGKAKIKRFIQKK